MEFKEQTAFEQFVNERFYNRLIVGGGTAADAATSSSSASSSSASAGAGADPAADVQLKISYAGMLRVGIDFHINPPRGRHPCEDAIVIQPLANNAGLVMVVCDGHFPESGKKPFDNCTARAGRWFGTRMAERMRVLMDGVLADAPDAVHNPAGQATLRARIVALVAELDEEFSRDQVDAILRFACQEKFVQRGLLTKKGAAVSAEQCAAHPYLAAPLPVGVPCDDGCTMVCAVLLPTMLITANVGDSRLTLLRAADLSTRFATMDQDMTVKARVDHIVAAQGSLLRKGGPQSNHRLVSFLPKPGEKVEPDGLHYSHKVWSEARVALPEEWKEVDLLPNRYFKVTKTLNLAGTMGDISFKLSRATFVRLKQLVAEIEQTANASMAMPPAQAHQFLMQQLHPARLRLDLETRTIVDSTPDVAFCPIAPSDERLLVVLASDGLWQYLRTPDDSELCSVLQNFYPAVLAEMGADVRALAAKHNINLAAADDEQRAALIAELEENPKSVRRLMLALHRVVNELNTYVLMPQRSSNLVRDDFSVLCMDVQILRGLQLVPNTPPKDAAAAAASTVAAATPVALSVSLPPQASATTTVRPAGGAAASASASS